MFVTFFQELKSAGVPVTLREYLTLMQAMEADLASRRVEDFYYLSRAALVKDEGPRSATVYRQINASFALILGRSLWGAGSSASV
jgi:uncharacterized protein with von Willebrand factor type A (vWA) domain